MRGSKRGRRPPCNGFMKSGVSGSWSVRDNLPVPSQGRNRNSLRSATACDWFDWRRLNDSVTWAFAQHRKCQARSGRKITGPQRLRRCAGRPLPRTPPTPGARRRGRRFPDHHRVSCGRSQLISGNQTWAWPKRGLPPNGKLPNCSIDQESVRLERSAQATIL